MTELGRSLTYMVETLKARKRWSMEKTMDYIAGKLSVSRDALYKWRKGTYKPHYEVLGSLVEIGVQEAGMNRIWAERVLYQGKHPDRRAILQRLFPNRSTSVRHNLPRRPYRELIGRNNEIAEIKKSLAPEARDWLMPIEGIGGVGKSALALEIGWHFVEEYISLPSSRRFDAVIWASAKQEELVAAKEIDFIDPMLENLSDVYRIIADVLEWPNILKVPYQEQHREVEKALNQAGRTLIILDNLETVEDKKVFSFLRRLPHAAKAIATMRYNENMPYPIRLRNLDEAASKQLIRQACEAHNLSFTEAQIGHLQKYTLGIPLAIMIAVGLMSMEGTNVDKTLKTLSAPGGKLLDFIYRQVVELL